MPTTKNTPSLIASESIIDTLTTEGGIRFFETELAWAAGFFDGEGTSRCQTQNKPNERQSRTYGSFRIQIAQALDQQILERFRIAVGVGKVYGPYQPPGTRRKAYFVYSAGGNDAVLAFKKLFRFLSSVKQTHGLKALEIYQNLLSRPRLGNGMVQRRKLATLKETK